MNNKFFKLFASCIPVNGARRSGICDVQRGVFDTIPNSLYEILEDCKEMTYTEIILTHGKENVEIIDAFFVWLIDKEYGFWCDSKEEFMSFPEMKFDWDEPYEITNMIIDIDSTSTIDYSNVFHQVIEMGIPHIQIRAYSVKNIDFYTQLFKLCDESRIRTIDVITPYYAEVEQVDFKKLCKHFLRINSFIFTNSPSFRKQDEINGLTKIIFLEHFLGDQRSCGIVSPSFFNINKELVTESMHHNTCLNRKISIDINGEIKNCPSMTEGFGNINTVLLKSVLKVPEFKKYWNIKKDDIDICKVCEFRHICTDCRAFRENPMELNSKPLKCGYDPYTATWEDWSKNPLKQKAIQHYGLVRVES